MKTRRHAVAASVWIFSLLSQGTSPTEAAAEAFAPAAGQETLRVDLVRSTGFSPKSMEKLKLALDTIERVLNSDEFRRAVLDFTYDGKKQFALDDGLTNEQVYAKIMAARETYSPAADYVAQLDLNLYTPPWYKKWSVVGYTYPNQPAIYMNWYYFNSFTPQEIAGNVTHEWTHKIGFEHDYGHTARRPYSVPYAVGDIVTRLSSRYIR